MKIFITGGTGFIGTALARDLLENGHQVVAVATSLRHRGIDHENFEYISADTTESGEWQEEIPDCDAVVNLAGRSIFTRWTESYKKKIYDSRIQTTRNVVKAIPEGSQTVLCSASAVGYYGSSGDHVLKESDEAGEGFLAEVGVDWEKEARCAEDKEIRTAIFRLGVVLGKDGGAMEKMIPAFKMYLGGPLGDGKQWFPWVHLQDVIGAMKFLIENKDQSGPYNFTAPHPVRNKDLADRLGKLLRVPTVLRVPGFMLRLAMGEFGEVLLESQRAIPDRLTQNGYSFQYPELEAALQQIIG
ncbi:MAG TPA: TIGR01777 family oxidoreductase [Desulfobacterales bacterium]